MALRPAEDGGRWLTWLLATDCCTTTLQPAAGGIFRGQRGAESGEGGEGDMYDRCVALRPAEDGGRWRKMGVGRAAGGGNIYAALTDSPTEELGELEGSWPAESWARGKKAPGFGTRGG